MKNALTVDVEEWFQVSNFDGIVSRESWPTLPSRVEASTRELLDLFDEHDALGTFFVLGWVAEHHPMLVREIRERGHDIASHGYGHELVYRLSPEAFGRDLDRAQAAIVAASGVAPRGYRAPSFSIDGRSFWALNVLVERGFKYDSSIFPVRHPRYGLPGFSRSPTRVSTASGRELIEFPLTTWRLLGRNLGAAGGGYLRLFPPFVIESAFRAMNEAGEPAVLYVHPWEIDPDQPRLRVRGLGRLTHYANLARTKARLRRMLERFEFAPMEACLALSPSVRAPARQCSA